MIQENCVWRSIDLVLIAMAIPRISLGSSKIVFYIGG
jgi:hypothetical protein